MSTSIRRFFIFLLLSLTSTSALASNTLLDIAVGWTKPPYVISENNSGFELDLVREVFKRTGRNVNFIFIPYGRSYDMLKQGHVDGVMTLKPGIDIGKGVLSDSYVSYHNTVISRKKSNLKLFRLSDLSRYSIAAFQKSRVVLGKQYAKAVAKSPMYLEMADQRKQIELFMLGRVDLVVMDINIFKYWLANVYGQPSLSQFDVHDLFEPVRYSLGLANPSLKDTFNQSLRQYRASGRYLKLLQQYRLEQ